MFPDEEGLAAAGVDAADGAALEALLLREVSAHNAARPDYHHEDHIGHVQVRMCCRAQGIELSGF